MSMLLRVLLIFQLVTEEYATSSTARVRVIMWTTKTSLLLVEGMTMFFFLFSFDAASYGMHIKLGNNSP